MHSVNNMNDLAANVATLRNDLEKLSSPQEIDFTSRFETLIKEFQILLEDTVSEISDSDDKVDRHSPDNAPLGALDAQYKLDEALPQNNLTVVKKTDGSATIYFSGGGKHTVRGGPQGPVQALLDAYKGRIKMVVSEQTISDTSQNHDSDSELQSLTTGVSSSDAKNFQNQNLPMNVVAPIEQEFRANSQMENKFRQQLQNNLSLSIDEVSVRDDTD